MDEYEIMLYPQAYRDLEDIYDYIALMKFDFEDAKNQTDRIKEAIKKLKYMPYAHQDRLEGYYSGKGYKQLLVDNYMAIYKIDEENKIVKIVTIQYQRRNI